MGTTATLTSKGQLTVPKEIRERLGLEKGDVIEFVDSGPSEVKIRPLRGSLADLAGMLHRPGMRRRSIAEMDEAVREAVAKDDERIRSGR